VVTRQWGLTPELIERGTAVPRHIACVGFEAIEHLAASRLMGRGHPGGRMGHVDRRPTV